MAEVSCEGHVSMRGKHLALVVRDLGIAIVDQLVPGIDHQPLLQFRAHQPQPQPVPDRAPATYKSRLVEICLSVPHATEKDVRPTGVIRLIKGRREDLVGFLAFVDRSVGQGQLER
jgi:hypothetical protein